MEFDRSPRYCCVALCLWSSTVRGQRQSCGEREVHHEHNRWRAVPVGTDPQLSDPARPAARRGRRGVRRGLQRGVESRRSAPARFAGARRLHDSGNEPLTDVPDTRRLVKIYRVTVLSKTFDVKEVFVYPRTVTLREC